MPAKQKAMWFEVVSKNDIKTIQRMLKEGFDVNVKDSSGWTALHFTCSLGYTGIAELLIDNGADINTKDDEDWIPLHNACYWGKIDIAKLLIDSGANITARDVDGDTPLDRLKQNNPKRYQELLQWLSEEYPEKALELMASEKIQGNGIGL